jgi:UDP-N-acetyl-D-mannosaminuronic acid dehydrogenase
MAAGLLPQLSVHACSVLHPFVFYKVRDVVMKAVFMGPGYIGLPAAAAAASRGIAIAGADVNPDAADTVSQGKIHIAEPDPDKLEKGYLKAALQPEAADAFFIAVPAPFRQNHRADISCAESAARTVIPYLREGSLCVTESASPVLTAGKMAERIFKKRPELKNKIFIAYVNGIVLFRPDAGAEDYVL